MAEKKATLKRHLKACFDVVLDKTIFIPELVTFIDDVSNARCLPFSSVFAGILAATSSICSKSYVKVYRDTDIWNLPFTLYIINAGLASSNKSCCTDLIKG
jgi:hypothetical protein